MTLWLQKQTISKQVDRATQLVDKSLTPWILSLGSMWHRGVLFHKCVVEQK